MGLRQWLSAGAAMVDVGRTKRVDAAAKDLWRCLATDRSAFDLDRSVSSLDVYREDVPLVLEATYRSLVAKAWQDRNVTDGERRTLSWAATALRIPTEAKLRIEGEVGISAIREFIADIGDAAFDATKAASIRQMAECMNSDVEWLVRHYFTCEITALLRAMFDSAASDRTLLEREWNQMRATVEALGLGWETFLQMIAGQAERFVEQTLADAKADGVVDQAERENLAWLMSKFRTDTRVRVYVAAELERLDLVSNIERGRLPSLVTNYAGIRSGEIVHLECPASFNRTRTTSRGERHETHEGRVIITDCRFLFEADTLGLDINHRKVINLQPYSNGVGVTTSGKGTGYYLPRSDPDLFTRIYQVAVRKANQTILEDRGEERRTRHIPREVKQRVWQRDGGLCVDCGGKDYLEYDHVIPHAKGGSNDVANVQLLCRRCNGKKSDSI